MKICDCVLAGLIPVLASCGGNSSGSASCGNATPCGGNVVGVWTVTQSCINMDSATSPVDGCPQAKGDASNARLSGTVSFTADGTYSVNMTISGDIVITVPAACLTRNGITATCTQVSQAAANQGSAVTCSDVGGGSCACKSSIPSKQIAESGTYTTAGNTLTMIHEGQTDRADYCLRGKDLVFSPHSGSSSGITGVIIGAKQ